MDTPIGTSVMLLECPFCGEMPNANPWHGGGPLKVMIHCTVCEVAPCVTGETPQEAEEAWNKRDGTGSLKESVTVERDF